MKSQMLLILVLVAGFCQGAELSLPDGGSYVGDVKNNAANGVGKTVYKDGTTAEGVYVNGIFVKGKLTYPDGNFDEGEFQDGKLTKGYSKQMDDEGEGWTAEGYFDKNGDLTNGRFIYDDGTVEEGLFENGNLAKGKITFPIGTTEEIGGSETEGSKYDKLPVQFNYRGDWQKGEVYFKGDYVDYNDTRWYTKWYTPDPPSPYTPGWTTDTNEIK